MAGLSLYEKQNRTALISITGVGRKTFRNILKTRRKLGLSWEDFWVNKEGIWQKSGANKRTCESILKFINEYNIYSYWEYLWKKDIWVVDELDEYYPKLLFEAEDRPPVLFVKGDISNGKGVIGNGKRVMGSDFSIWNKTPIAVVGTRKITSYGRMVTQKIVRELVLEGATIISGFMYGVDVCAQLAAVEAGGKTVGVLGYGFDNVSPWHHKKIMEKMLKKGAVFITEYPPWMSGSPGTFPQRNRIVAGMSLGVVVTEAAQKSGSHITASLALENGREVFAVPGSIASPYSVGTKDLIKQGAIMVGSGREVLDEIGSGKGVIGGEYENYENRVMSNGNEYEKELSTEEKIVDLLRVEAMSGDELARELELEIVELTSVLSLLEITGKIVKEGGRYYL